MDCDIQIKFENQYIEQIWICFRWKPKLEVGDIACRNRFPKSIGIIFKCSFYLSWNFPTFLFYSLMYSYLYYCIISWASTYQTNLCRLFILQKRLLKSLNKSHFKAHPWRNLVNKTPFASTGPIYVFNCKNSFLPSPGFKNNSPKATISLLQY